MRYERQFLIPEIGSGGQEKLRQSKVLVVGAGGLGSPVLTYLTEAGVGNITLVDSDIVTESNLNRQFLYTTSDIGREKALCATEKLGALNPDVSVSPLKMRVDKENAGEIILGADVVVDCVDSVETRLIVNAACLKQGIPLVEGGVDGFYGFVMCIRRESACLRCVGYCQRNEPKPAPIIGCTAGVIGSLQANECIKILLRIGEPLFSKMLTYDGYQNSFDVVLLERNPLCEEYHI